jgi:hypothetical protein
MVLAPCCGHRLSQIHEAPHFFRRYRIYASVQEEAHAEPRRSVARYVPYTVRIRIPLVEGETPRLTPGIHLGVANPGVQPERLLRPPFSSLRSRSARVERNRNRDLRRISAASITPASPKTSAKHPSRMVFA